MRASETVKRLLHGSFATRSGPAERYAVSRIDHVALSSWLREIGHAEAHLEELSGDVSPRRYVRVRHADGGSSILAWYPEELRDTCGRFARTTDLLERAAVPVPRILAVDCERGVMSLEDAGERNLFELRDRPLAERLPAFERAIEIAARIGAVDRDEVAALNPPLDAVLLRSELGQTVDTFLEPRALLGNAVERRGIERAFDRLCRALGETTPVPCHRDFMSRNLVPRADGVVVLDHQDLRLGPPGYDLASLLNDSFFPPPDIESELLAGQPATESARVAYHRAAAQRTLKAVGTFAAFAARGFERHLPLIPPTLERALHHLALAPETSSMAPMLEALWSPALEAGPESG